MSTNTIRANAYKLISELFKYPEKDLVGWTPVLVETFTEISPELGELASSITQFLEGHNSIDDLQIEYAKLFVGPYELEAAPYSSVYLDPQGLVMGPSTHQAIEFYTQAGLDPNEENKQPPDHISTELEFMYYLLFNSVKNNDDTQLHLADSFLNQHLSKWVSLFVEKIRENSASSFYQDLGQLLQKFISTEIELNKEKAI